MKVFISTNGKKTDEQIKEERALAVERIKCQFPDEEIEIINSSFKNTPQNANRLWLLGESIKLLADADLAYFIKGWDMSKGCKMENKIAKKYGINVIEERKEKDGIGAKFIKGSITAIIELSFSAKNDDEAARIANTIASNAYYYPEFTITCKPMIRHAEGEVILVGSIKNDKESKDSIIKIANRPDLLCRNTDAENVHARVSVDGKTYEMK